MLASSPRDWPKRVAETLETFRAPDGGYAKAVGSASGSTYHTFLVGLCSRNGRLALRLRCLDGGVAFGFGGCHIGIGIRTCPSRST